MTPMLKYCPKMLRVNHIPEQRSINKHLLKPWAAGEIVRVAPEQEQENAAQQSTTPNFRKRYLVVYRRDENGKFTLRYVEPWESFDIIKAIKI